MKKRKIKVKEIKIIFSNQKGMALLTTLIFVFILVTFAVALLTMTSNDTKLSALQRDSTKAFYIAEAGIEQTLYNLKKNFESSQNWINYDKIEDEIPFYFADGECTVTLDIESFNNVTIKSKGKYNNSIRYVQVDAKVEVLSMHTSNWHEVNE